MKAMQPSLVVFFALVIQVLTSVATTPTSTTPTPTHTNYEPGDMIRVKPSAWEVAEKKKINRGSKIEHFGTVVGKAKDNQKYQIAHISHKLPAADYPYRDVASKYHEKAHHNSMINTGTPKEVAPEHLRSAKESHDWDSMKPEKLANLKDEIQKNCPDVNLRKRGLGCPLLKPNRNAPKVNGKKARPKPNQSASKGKSRQLNGKKARPKSNQSAPKGKSRQLKGKKARHGSKPNRNVPHHFQEKKAWSRPKPNKSAPQGKLRQLQGKKGRPGPKPNQNAPREKSRQLHAQKA